jgi:hypothetical protein
MEPPFRKVYLGLERLGFFIACSLLVFFSLAAYAEKNPNYFFPKNELSVGFYDNDFFGTHFSRPPKPIFWHAHTKATSGFTFAYERNLYHSKKWFSINLGTSFSSWNQFHNTINALSLFIDFKLWIPIQNNFRPYLFYSVGGPTLLSKQIFGHTNLGSRFILQDLLGGGVQIGKKQALDIALLLGHYSNAGIFQKNPGFDVPIILKIGYAF